MFNTQPRKKKKKKKKVVKLLILCSWQHHATIGLRTRQSMMRERGIKAALACITCLLGETTSGETTSGRQPGRRDHELTQPGSAESNPRLAVFDCLISIEAMWKGDVFELVNVTATCCSISGAGCIDSCTCCDTETVPH